MFHLLRSLHFSRTKHWANARISMSYFVVSQNGFFVLTFDRGTIDFDLDCCCLTPNCQWPQRSNMNLGSNLKRTGVWMCVAMRMQWMIYSMNMVCMCFYWYNHLFHHMWMIWYWDQPLSHHYHTMHTDWCIDPKCMDFCKLCCYHYKNPFVIHYYYCNNYCAVIELNHKYYHEMWDLCMD